MASDEMTIRSATREDVAQIAWLVNAAYAKYLDRIEKPPAPGPGHMRGDDFGKGFLRVPPSARRLVRFFGPRVPAWQDPMRSGGACVACYTAPRAPQVVPREARR
jgi:hypothetical protein